MVSPMPSIGHSPVIDFVDVLFGFVEKSFRQCEALPIGDSLKLSSQVRDRSKWPTRVLGGTV
jgi:hypothetical protein